MSIEQLQFLKSTQSPLPNGGSNSGAFLYWNSTSGTWKVGTTNVIIGAGAGGNNSNSVSIGYQANSDASGLSGYSVSIGYQAGFTGQKDGCVAIGSSAGSYNQASGCIAIGNKAGETDQHQNTVIINGSPNALNSSTSFSTYIAPIRQLANVIPNSFALYYDTNTCEIYGVPTKE